MLMLDKEKWGFTSFKFSNAWLNLPSFESLLKSWWSKNPIIGWPGHGFILKLKNFKKEIKGWSGNTYGKSKEHKHGLISELNRLDALEELGQLYEALCTYRTIIPADHLTIAARDDALWRQRCKVTWLIEGDENTTFFHRIVAANKRKNYIADIISATGHNL